MKVILLTIISFILVAVSTAIELEDEDGVPMCVCPLIYRPVCASDGKTYGNPCEVQCESNRMRSDLTITAYRECEGFSIIESIAKRFEEQEEEQVNEQEEEQEKEQEEEQDKEQEEEQEKEQEKEQEEQQEKEQEEEQE